MKIEIKHRISGQIIVAGDYGTLKECMEKNRGANLGGANLGGAYLGGANLVGANLGGAINYRDSHDIFSEVVRRQSVSVFVDSEWSAIAQITIHRLCWDSIKNRFAAIMPHIFEVLAGEGFSEWLKHWESITKEG